MGQQTEEYNYWAQFTVAELQDLYWDRDERLARLQEAEPELYTVGYSHSWLGSCSQQWGINACKEEMKQIDAEIARRRGGRADEMAEDTTRD